MAGALRPALKWLAVALLLAAAQSLESETIVQLSLLDVQPADLTVYHVARPAESTVARYSDVEPYYYFGVFQALRTHPKENCTPRAIDDFPADMFTEDQRRHGAVVVHFFLIAYSMLMICTAVDDFFVPSLEILADALHMSPDVAGATIMAMGTSVPELFFNIIGTFITQGDIGIGTVVGSDVFNILAAPAFCGIFSGIIVDIDWYSLTRDCLFYGLVVIAQICFIYDDSVFWWEAMILVISYSFYILVMYFNSYLEKKVTGLVSKFCCCIKAVDELPSATTDINDNVIPSITIDTTESSVELEEIKKSQAKDEDATTVSIPNESTPMKLFERPKGHWLRQLFFYLMWPSNVLFLVTIPDVRRGGRWKKFYLLGFLACISWVGALSYMVTWWITVIGDTLGIPDSEMGITFLAAGGSIPQGYALYVVAKQGNGRMGISGAVGSNAFDMMVCIGLPWLIKSLVSPKYPDEGKFVVINSEGVVYSVAMLLVAVVLFYFTIAFNKWRLDRRAGLILVVGYAAFVILASLFELNVFFQVNAPTCK